MRIFNRKIILIPAIVCCCTIVIVLLRYQHVKAITHEQFDTEDQQRIQDIEAYINSISADFVQDLKLKAPVYNIQPLACGPSSYAFAKIISNKFFNGTLSIDTSYDNNPYEIVERFGFANTIVNGQPITTDHAWLEIYVRDKILFVDPTISQFNKVHGIAYKVFDVGDANFRQYLKDEYDITDNRISRLYQKAIRKIPINQEPYPGFAIDPKYMDYFTRVVDIVNIVNIGQQPPQWNAWVDFLTNKYK